MFRCSKKKTIDWFILVSLYDILRIQYLGVIVRSRPDPSFILSDQKREKQKHIYAERENTREKRKCIWISVKWRTIIY